MMILLNNKLREKD